MRRPLVLVLTLIAILVPATATLATTPAPPPALAPATAPDEIGTTEQKVLDFIFVKVDQFEDLEDKGEATDEARAEYHAALLRAADVADFLDLNGAEAEACNVLARIHFDASDLARNAEYHSREPIAESRKLEMEAQSRVHRARAEELYTRAMTAARRGRDVPREMAAQRGLLAILFRSEEEDAGDRFQEMLRAYADVATADGRAIEAMPWIATVVKQSPWIGVRFDATIMTGLVTFGMDDIAKARLTGDEAGFVESIGKLIGRGFPLTAGLLAEEIDDLTGLRAAFERHEVRGDAVAQARVGRRLVGLLPDGPSPAGDERRSVRHRTFVAALAGEDPGLSEHIVKAESADDDRPDWLREGRSPPEGDDFTASVSKALAEDIDWLAKLNLIEFAQVDGSHAFVDPLFDLLDPDAHNDPMVGGHAALALGELAALEDLPRILKALKHEGWVVRRAMALVLGRLQAQDPDLTDLIEVHASLEQHDAVRAALLWGLLKAGRFDDNLDALTAILDHGDARAAATAAIALFDHGYGSATALLEKHLQPDSDGPEVYDAVQMLGFTERTDAVPALERFLDHENTLVTGHAARALNQLDTPRARDARRRRMLRTGGAMAPVWLGLRDGRRDLLDPESLARLVRRRNSDNLDRYAYSADLANWVVGESMGKVKFKIPVGRDAHTTEERNALRGLEERKPYPRLGRHGSDMVFGDMVVGERDADDPAAVDPAAADPTAGDTFKVRAKARERNRNRSARPASRKVSMVYEESLAGAVVVVHLAPQGTLVDETYLAINLNLTQRHSGFNTDLLGALWVNFDLVLEAEGVLREARLEGLPGGALVADYASAPSFDLPAGTTTAQVRGATLVLAFKFFDKESTERFALGPSLLVGQDIKPDLIVEKVAVDPAAPRPNQPTEVRFDVVNVGHAKSKPTVAYVYAHNKQWPAEPRPIGRIGIPALEQGQRVETSMGVSVTSEYYLNDYTPGWTPDDQDTSIEVVVDPDDTIEELDEDNNRGVRPVALILTEDEKQARQFEHALEQLASLLEHLETVGPEVGDESLSPRLDKLLESLEAVHPRTPGLDKAIKLMRMLGAQNDARDRIRDAIGDIANYTPAANENDADDSDGNDESSPDDDEAARIMAELLRGQADLLRSGVPVSPEQITALDENVKAFHHHFGDEYPVFDADQAESVESAARSVRVAEGVKEILGDDATGSSTGDFGDMLGPRLDPERRAASEEFLRKNIDWNNDGMTLANDTFRSMLATPDDWFANASPPTEPPSWNGWSGPDADLEGELELVQPTGDDSPLGPPAEKTIKSLMGRFGF